MPRRDKTVYLNDIVGCCDELRQLYIDANNFNQFASNNYFVRTAERCLQIIGEALYHINNYDRNIPINHKHQIIKLRHLLTHDYDIIESDRLWLYIQDFVPELRTEVTEMLQAGNDNI